MATKTTTKTVSVTKTENAALQTEKKRVSRAKKAEQAQAQKPVLFYADLLKQCLGGAFGNEIRRFYVNALAYHKKQGTSFPRARIASEPLLGETDAIDFIKKHEKTSIPAGNKAGQRLFDEMMVQARQTA